MDLDHHLSLRSFDKPESSSIYKFIFGAAVIHVLFMLDFSTGENKNTAELPEWINIKLTSYSEPINNKKQDKHVIQEKDIKKNRALQKKNKADKRKENAKKSKPTTFIAADSKPYFLENPKPVYPSAARKRGMQGIVLLSVGISKEGNVESIDVLQTSGFKVLDRSAVSSVQQWRFIPAKQGEKNISSKLEIPIRFTLKV